MVEAEAKNASVQIRDRDGSWQDLGETGKVAGFGAVATAAGILSGPPLAFDPFAGPLYAPCDIVMGRRKPQSAKPATPERLKKRAKRKAQKKARKAQRR